MRRWLWVLLVLLSPVALLAQTARQSEQTNAYLLWEDRADLHATSTYAAMITSVVEGRAVRRVQALVPYASDECHLLAAIKGQDWTPDTLCADLCVPMGDTTVTLTASTPGWLSPSPPSNEAHETVTQPCGSPPVAPPAPRSSPKLPAWAVGAGAVAVSGAATLKGSPPTLTSLVNPQCVSWRITGPCACGFPPSPCMQVEYFEPTSIIEIVKQPGTSTLPILGDLLKVGLAAMGVSLFGGGGAGNSAGAGNTNLQYAEAHVWSFPQIFGGPCTACAPINALPRLQYASEADAASWRMTTAPPGIPPPALLPVGTWGMLFPRVGFAINHSAPVASGLQAFRALNIAFQPVTPLPIPEAHVVLSHPQMLSGCMQMAYPKVTPCLLAGTPAPLWEHGAVSANGSYIWIVWTKRVCCVPPPGTCGITLPGPLGHGANLCPL